MRKSAGRGREFRQPAAQRQARERLFECARADPDPQVRGGAWRALSGETEHEEIYRAMLACVTDASAASGGTRRRFGRLGAQAR